MTSVKSIVISLIFCVITISICELLVPKNTYNNQMRLVTGAVLLITMISPFVSGIDFSEFNFEKSSDYDFSEISHKTVAYAYKTEIFDILENNNITNSKITVTTDLDENNSIKVKSVIILFDKRDKNKIPFVKKDIKEKLDVDIQAEINQ